MSLKIILASHGKFALAALQTAEMIIGNSQEQVTVISVTPGRTYDECLAELQTIYQQYQKPGQEVLILVDIYGGTPANISTYLTLTAENVQVYSGLNLPVLMELLLSKPENLADAKKIVNEIGQNVMTDITAASKKEVDNNGDQMDSY
ncbi:PTS sugar transporter subunit IIA [Xylocopilactobacillus apicola]|uniref:PTS mannose transporter subunit IID n=1 Tax=Xylocopilactobacillus apicola TaxID=2932184 RepID=A0AAU9DTY0_9LACO|nr:hypothetical protein [Xylocopilactobacillus apicola]BDR58898.1 PTS mannose transporter subunit IID [Xylocopilactobacillus apicola]